MSHGPLFAQPLGINRERRQGVGRAKPEAVMHGTEHPENAAFLHLVQGVPELFLREGVLELKLRLHFFSRGEQRETGVRRAERVGGEGVKGELHAAAVDQLFAESFFGFPLSARAPIETALASGFVINNPNLRKTEAGVGPLTAAQHQIDSPADAECFVFPERNLGRRIEFPLRGQPRPVGEAG